MAQTHDETPPKPINLSEPLLPSPGTPHLGRHVARWVVNPLVTIRPCGDASVSGESCRGIHGLEFAASAGFTSRKSSVAFPIFVPGLPSFFSSTSEEVSP